MQFRASTDTAEQETEMTDEERIDEVYHNHDVLDRLKHLVSGEVFVDWEPCYFGYSEADPPDVYIIATWWAATGDQEGAGFWAFRIQEKNIELDTMYLCKGDSVYENTIRIAKFLYPLARDLVLD